MRDRLARRLVSNTRPSAVEPVLEPLLAIHRGAHAKVDPRQLQRGYDVAAQCHRGQLRKSGDPYITHPLAVATILAELGMDTTTLVAALLHDTVEDTGLTLADVEEEFGAEVAHLVDGVTKLDKVKFGAAAEAETIRKMVVAMARDPRVLVIKLADRLHNMRTLRFLPPEKQERKARETLEVLAPLAHRLGMNTVKWELEDLAFATLYPKRYDEIVRLVAERAPSRDTYLGEVIDRINRDLRAGGIKADRHRPAEALLLDLPEDDRARPRVHRHLRPRRHPRPRRGRARVLRDPRRHPRELATGARPVQGLHRDAEVQHVPVTAHHGDRSGRQAGRAADPHARDAPHRRVRHRRALEVQGAEEGRDRRPRQRRLDEMGWLRQMLDWQREAQEPEEFLDIAALRPRRRSRSTSSPPRAT